MKGGFELRLMPPCTATDHELKDADHVSTLTKKGDSLFEQQHLPYAKLGTTSSIALEQLV